MINLFLEQNSNYKSKSQIIRNITENWVEDNIFCPICGLKILKYKNNNPCSDFYCKNCFEDYELKSKKNNFGSKIIDGEYNTMIKKINSNNPSNFFFLSYNNMIINDFFIIPKFFFTESIIEKRKPLSEKAKRSGWIGCNILYKKLPESAKIFYIKNKQIFNKEEIINNYKKLLFIEKTNKENKNWLLDVMFCIENLHKDIFILDDLYKKYIFFKNRHPNNNHINDKIRQQLQFLRDKGFVEFLGRGKYKIIK